MESSSQTTIIITLVVGFLTSIAASLFGIWKDGSNRKADEKKAILQRQWELEDRRENNAKLLAATETVAIEVSKATVIADEKREILAAVVEVGASEILHHAKQPVFDVLIDKFKDPTSMSDQEMIQFIQRLEVIANDTRKKTPQQPAARLMLDRALTVARGRSLRVATRAELGENRAAGEAMRIEAEPQKGKHDIGERLADPVATEANAKQLVGEIADGIKEGVKESLASLEVNEINTKVINTKE